jgi:2-oxoglutarate/2-oxoacid ferredoxin oxidoreductase subunit beta
MSEALKSEPAPKPVKISKTFSSEDTVEKYLRTSMKFPHVWCPGCGIGTIMASLIRAIDSLGWEKDNIAMVSGIGCTGRMPAYVDFNTLHTTHGRALSFATGLKLARPDMHIIAVMGDGDAIAIGGNHFIHTCRRNIGITAIVVNNETYGMTGGQYSPTTPHGMKGTTARYGNLEYPFDVAEMAASAGAPFVARTSVYHVLQMDQILKKALSKDELAVVEVVSNCHTGFGRLNRLGGAPEMLKWMKDHSVPKAKAEKMEPDELEDKFTVGVLKDEHRPSYMDLYTDLIKRLDNRE